MNQFNSLINYLKLIKQWQVLLVCYYLGSLIPWVTILKAGKINDKKHNEIFGYDIYLTANSAKLFVSII